MKTHFLSFVFILLGTFTLIRAKEEVSNVLDTLLTDYDRRIRPNLGGSPVKVGVTMYVLDVHEISESNMDFTLDMYFRQNWKDPRLAYTARSSSLEKIDLSGEFGKNLWIPDTFFVNGKKGVMHSTTVPNQFVRIYKTGEVLISSRLQVTASCAMDLRFYPMDSQLCTLEMESFGSSLNDIIYEWGKGPKDSVGISSHMALPDFKIIGYNTRSFETKLTTGNYSRLVVEIQFVRSIGSRLSDTYFPVILIVIISWTAFWIPKSAVSTRVILSLATSLSILQKISTSRTEFPNISYSSALDVYLKFSFAFVFLTLLEHCTVFYMDKQSKMMENESGEDEANAAKTLVQKYNLYFKKISKCVVSAIDNQDCRKGMNMVSMDSQIHGAGPSFTLLGVNRPLKLLLIDKVIKLV